MSNQCQLYPFLLVVILTIVILVYGCFQWFTYRNVMRIGDTNARLTGYDDQTIVDLRTFRFPRRPDESMVMWHARLPPPLKVGISDAPRQDKLHLGIIPDGNRRWSHQYGLSYIDAIRTTLMNLEKMATKKHNKDTLSSFKRIGSVTIFGASTFNLLYRDTDDIQTCIQYLQKTWNTIKHNATADQLRSVYVAWVGNASFRFRWGIEPIINDIEQYTAKEPENASLCIYLLLGYDPLLHNDCRAHGQSVDQPFLDLVIRTGGDQRLSGFAPLHAAYSELFFLNKHAPDLTEDDILACLKDYDQRRKPQGR